MFQHVYLNFSHKILRALTPTATIKKASLILHVTKPRVSEVIKKDPWHCLTIIDCCQIYHVHDKALC